MPYVSRDESGSVNGVYANPQPDYAEEYLPDDDPEVLAFLNPPPTRREEADAHLAAGLTVNFPTEQPGLGTYSVIPPDSHNINAISTGLATDGTFPNNQTEVAIFDLTATLHTLRQKHLPAIRQGGWRFYPYLQSLCAGRRKQLATE